MISHNTLKKQISEQEAKLISDLTEYYEARCEKEFMHAVNSGERFPFTFKLDAHLLDTEKRGATVIREFFKKHGYYIVNISYDAYNALRVEVCENGKTHLRKATSPLLQ